MGDGFTVGLEVPGKAAQSAREAREDPNRVDIVEFEVPDNIGVLDIGTLLFRPGHYDVLIKMQAPASPDVSIPRNA